MSQTPIGVGIIGASPDAGWASVAHVPAVQALPELTLSAVATSRAESARAAAEKYGAPHAFSDPVQLVAHPDVDLVVVAVKVPAHGMLVRTALDAGKAVLCEWPLTPTTDEALELARLARERRLPNAIMLQARFAPAVQHARRLIEDGYVGQVLSVGVTSSLQHGAGGVFPERQRYTFDPANGVDVVSIAGGHTLDAVQYLVGDVTGVSARLGTPQPMAVIAETGERLAVSTPDQMLLHAELAEGGLLSMHVHARKGNGARTVIDVTGTEGDLRLESAREGDLPGVQMQQLRLLGARGRGGALQELPLPSETRWVPDTLAQPALNVAQVYARLAQDLRRGTPGGAPDFEHAVRLHRLLDDLRTSAAR